MRATRSARTGDAPSRLNAPTMPHMRGCPRFARSGASGSARRLARHVAADGADALEVLRVELRRRDLDPELLLQVEDEVDERQRVEHARLQQVIVGADSADLRLPEHLLGQE